jgi:hypothetical protein
MARVAIKVSFELPKGLTRQQAVEYTQDAVGVHWIYYLHDQAITNLKRSTVLCV